MEDPLLVVFVLDNIPEVETFERHRLRKLIRMSKENIECLRLVKMLAIIYLKGV